MNRERENANPLSGKGRLENRTANNGICCQWTPVGMAKWIPADYSRCLHWGVHSKPEILVACYWLVKLWEWWMLIVECGGRVYSGLALRLLFWLSQERKGMMAEECNTGKQRGYNLPSERHSVFKKCKLFYTITFNNLWNYKWRHGIQMKILLGLVGC